MKKLLWLMAMAIVLAACSSIECPLNNSVYATYKLYDADGNAYTLSDTLSILTKKHTTGDTTLLNSKTNATSFTLPMSYAGTTDVLILEMKDTLHNVVYDTITINKTNTPHFESTECGPAFFHTIEGVSHTSHKIESVIINDKEVNYDATKEHIQILFKSGD